MSLYDLMEVLNHARVQLINSDDGAIEGTFEDAADIPEEYHEYDVDDVYPYRIDRETGSDEEPVLVVCISQFYEEEE